MEVPAGSVLGGVLVGALLLAVTAAGIRRPLLVNLARRRRRLRPIPWKDIRRSTLSVPSLRAADDAVLAGERTLWRQKEWEKHLYHQEIAKRGYAWSRAYCSEHGRYCRTAGGPHPPGGEGGPPMPEDFDPDATPLAGPRRTDGSG